MKTRFGYVSNSSSSSFLVAYDKSFYGDLVKLVLGNQFGFESNAWDVPDDEEIVHEAEKFFCDDKVVMDAKIKQMKDLMAAGKAIAVLTFDTDTEGIIKLIEQVNSMNGGDKFIMIYGEPS